MSSWRPVWATEHDTECKWKNERRKEMFQDLSVNNNQLFLIFILKTIIVAVERC